MIAAMRPLNSGEVAEYLAGHRSYANVRETEEGVEVMRDLAQEVRTLVAEYEDTIGTPGQAQDIAEADLAYALRDLVAEHIAAWGRGRYDEVEAEQAAAWVNDPESLIVED